MDMVLEINKMDSEVAHQHKEAFPVEALRRKVRSVVAHSKEAIPVVVLKVDSAELHLAHNSLQLQFYLTKMLTMVMVATDSVMKLKTVSKLRSKEN